MGFYENGDRPDLERLVLVVQLLLVAISIGYAIVFTAAMIRAPQVKKLSLLQLIFAASALVYLLITFDPIRGSFFRWGLSRDGLFYSAFVFLPSMIGFLIFALAAIPSSRLHTRRYPFLFCTFLATALNTIGIFLIEGWIEAAN
jgi:hypothetical protein